MSSDVVILNIKDISKCFEIYEKPVHRLFQTLCAGRKKFYKEFWALQNINFEVCRGNFVGIIGRNGAGKSTLLQIITGTLAATGGTVEKKEGLRIGALLELGSGFNPEFTGRENVYLNATILGLTRDEIDQHYQEIVDFADIGEFIDQPVKNYSSGMMLRLAFAVQTFVKPDILIVDEALAVGDALFQRKCYAHIDKLKQEGTALLLVSHDTETIKQRCDHVLFLKDGCGYFYDDVKQGVLDYMRYLFPHEESSESGSPENLVNTAEEKSETPAEEFVLTSIPSNKDDCWGGGGGTITEIRLRGLLAPNILVTPGKLRIEIDFNWDPAFLSQKIAECGYEPNLMAGIRFADVKNNIIFETNNNIEHIHFDPFCGSKSATASFDVDLCMMKSGNLFLTVAIAVGNMSANFPIFWNVDLIQLQVQSPLMVTGLVYCPTKFSFEARA